MKLPLRYMPLLASALALAGLAGTANAATINVGGSSAGKNFATDVPLNLCDVGTSILDYPNKYVSADGNKISWSCKKGGIDTVMRYAATGSSDGINKLLVPTSNISSNMTFQNEADTTGCTGPVDTTRVSDTKHYNLYTGCTATVLAPNIVGASDVAGSSFHQTGPFGTSVAALDDTTLTSIQAAIVPFSLFVGKGVVALDAGGTVTGQIPGLSRLQIEQIFSGSTTNWQQLGLGTTATDGGALEPFASSVITLCMRNAGSGTKATFDETVMLNASEFAGFASATKVFSSSSSGVLTCLHNNRRAIGYMDADALTNFTVHAVQPPPPLPPVTDYFGEAYPVRIDGGLAYDAALTDKKKDLKCGKYPYWAGWRLNRRTSIVDPEASLAQAYIDNAGAQATIAIIPTGAFWAADEEMAVSKNVDKGPLVWKKNETTVPPTVIAHPECR